MVSTDWTWVRTVVRDTQDTAFVILAVVVLIVLSRARLAFYALPVAILFVTFLPLPPQSRLATRELAPFVPTLTPKSS